ncbi:DUF1104 domain-containing protein [Methanococcoides sp. SA1]|uniref:DUF1104 domain-containing protein n=1 Tax=Candidatus Desulfatifera sulfidica TaxID=2841691 RepID=A0A8J6NCC4_9BACT|nr:DUF1104 domain-containing protein [Candidatus Desulfatifera sulfidica]NPE29472.1 DUF1104 domain-containing protein [Methanococcoides sp. SA1]
MKNKKSILACALCLALLASPVWSAPDYSAMSNDEMAAMRGNMRDVSAEERASFQSEWQSRIQQMSPEERQKAVGRPDNAPADGTGAGGVRNRNRQQFRDQAQSAGDGLRRPRSGGKGGGGRR